MTDNAQELTTERSQLRVGIVKEGSLAGRVLLSVSADGQAEVTVNGQVVALQPLGVRIRAAIELNPQGTLILGSG